MPAAIALDAFSLLVGALGASGLRLWTRRLWPRARLPWAPPAATGGTCWNLTSPTDFCYQHEDRTHAANDHPSREAAFPSLPGRRCNVVPALGFPFVGQRCSDGERRVSEAEAPARRQWRRLRRPDSLNSACTRRCRGQLGLLRTPPSSPTRPPRELGPPGVIAPVKALIRPPARTVPAFRRA